MKVDQRIIQRFDELIKRGLDSIDTAKGTQPPSTSVEMAFSAGWQLSALNLLNRVMGGATDENIFYTNFKNLTTGDYHSYHAVFEELETILDAIHVLKAAKEEYEGGFLFDLRKLVEAEIFDDLLEQAEFLLGGGYYGPAAVTAGCVLEDSLRKLCDREGIIFPDKPKPTINTYNTELYKKAVYDKLTFKQVDVLGTLRNHAAHGEWEKFEKSHVEKMIPDVRDFMVKYFV